MAFDREVVTASGAHLAVEIDTICVHGDGPEAVAIAAAVREGLEARGAIVCPLDRMSLPNVRQWSWRRAG